jgi:hypothetical protein
VLSWYGEEAVRVVVVVVVGRRTLTLGDRRKLLVWV